MDTRVELDPAPYEPPPCTAGAPISWQHYPAGDPAGDQAGYADPVARTGLVWDRAPDAEAAQMVCWVVPDTPLPGDANTVLAVGRATRSLSGPYPRAAQGELFSYDTPTDDPWRQRPDLATLTIRAATWATRTPDRPHPAAAKPCGCGSQFCYTCRLAAAKPAIPDHA